MIVYGTPESLAGAADWPTSDFSRVRIVRELLRHFLTPGTPDDGKKGLIAFLTALRELDHAVRAAGLPAEGAVVDVNAPSSSRLLAALGLARSAGPPPVAETATEAAQRIRAHLARASIDVAQILIQLNAGQPVRIVVPMFEAPLPLGLEYWARDVIGGGESRPDVFAWLLTDKEDALFYIGLLGLDPETLGFFQTGQGLLRLARAEAATFAQFSSSIRVRAGRVLSPLGEEAYPAWQAIAKRSPADSVEFTKALLQEDQGRLAWFFDTVTRLSPAQMRFVLGMRFPTEVTAEEAFKTYKMFDTYSGDRRSLPLFRRDAFDPAYALSLISADAAGTALSPNSVGYLKTVLDDGGYYSQTRLPQASADEDLLTAARYLELVFKNRRGDEENVARAIAFGQRMSQRVLFNDWVNLDMTMRAWLLYPALFATLERASIDNVTTMYRVAMQGSALRPTSEIRDTSASMLQFQSAMALLQHARAAGTLTQPAIDELAVRLTQVPLSRDRKLRYEGRLVEWLQGYLLPEFRRAAGPDGATTTEELMLQMLAGRYRSRSRPDFTYEALEYQADTSVAEMSRLTTIRRQQSLPPLDSLLEFARLVKLIFEARNFEQVQALVPEMKRLGEPLVAHVDPKRELKKLLDETLKKLERIDKRTLSGREQVRGALNDLVDWSAAYSLLALAYVAALPNSSVAAANEDVAIRHDLGLTEGSIRQREETPWELPVVLGKDIALKRNCGNTSVWARCRSEMEPSRGTIWHVEGSAMGLDGALLATIVRPEGTTARERLGPRDQNALWQAASALPPAGRTKPASASEVAAVIKAGRAQVAEPTSALLTAPSWRFAAIPWVIEHEPEALRTMILPSELVSLNAVTERAALANWGGSAVDLMGCFCRTLPPAFSLERLAERPNSGTVSVFAAELRLALAELMVQEKIPVELMETLYRKALIARMGGESGSGAGDPSDWFPLAASLGHVSSDELSSYMQQLMIAGVVTGRR